MQTVEERRASRMAACAKWRSANPEKNQAGQAKYRADNSEKVRMATAKWRAANPERGFIWSRTRTLKQYGLTAEAYDTMLSKQGGVCVICGDPPGKHSLRIDHSHKSGEVRGLLCNNCNVAIGNAKDDPERLRKMAMYLDNHAKK